MASGEQYVLPGFDERDAQVACRQLGFDNYIFEGVARR